MKSNNLTVLFGLTVSLLMGSAETYAGDISLAAGTTFFTNWYAKWDAATAQDADGLSARQWLLEHVSESDLKMTFRKPVSNRSELEAFLNFLSSSRTTSQHELQAIQKIGPQDFLYSVTFLTSAPDRPDFNGTTLIDVHLEISDNGQFQIQKYEIKKLADKNQLPQLEL